MLEGHEYDSRWTVKDKLWQYRGLVTLCERDKKKSQKDLEDDKIQTSQKLTELKKEVRLLRLEVNDIVKRESFRSTIQDDRRLALALKRKDPMDLVEELQQRKCTKIREINRLKHLKSTKLKELENTMIKVEELKRKKEFHPSIQADKLRKEELIKEIEKTKVKQNTANCIRSTYKKMISLMKEDSWYLDHIIATLTLDADEQTRGITRVKEKGNRAVSESDKTLVELRNLEEKTVALIRTRERAIRQLRQQINVLKTRLQVMRSEEADERGKGFKLEMLTQINEDEYDYDTPFLLRSLEKGMEELQDATMVTDYRNIFARLHDQLEQRQRLLQQVTLCEQSRRHYCEKRECLQKSLDKIKHTYSEECKRHEEDEEEYRDKLQHEELRKEESNQLVEDFTKKLLDMRAVIITLHEIVGRVKTPDEAYTTTELVNEMTLQEIMSQIADPFTTLELIKEKVRKLRNEIGLAVENWPVTEMSESEKKLKEVKERQTPEIREFLEKDNTILDVARKEYHNKATEYVARAHFGGTVTELYDLQEVAENETGVISRAEIKQASRRLVKDNEVPLFGFGAKKGAKDLHKRQKPKRRKWTL